MVGISRKALLAAAVSTTVIATGALAQEMPQEQSSPKAESEVNATVIDTPAEQVPEETRASRVTLPQNTPTADRDPINTIEVTGSRLSDGDVTARKIVIDRAEIRRRGVTSVEDLIRTLPQNLATIGNVVNERPRGPLNQGRGTGGSIAEVSSLGVSAANLGGIGAGRTLVLVDGRRLAGAAGFDDGFVNLNGVPLSAIERVEIIPSGGGAIYGADAMAGVINFILRKDFRGFTLGGQYDSSNNGGDSWRINAYGGASWGSGHISATADFQKRFPIVNAKTGYVTNNYADRFAGDPFFDQRAIDNGAQPGLVDISTSTFDPATGQFVFTPQFLTVPGGLGRAPTRADLITVGREALRDFVPRYAGTKSDMLSFTANLEQNLADGLKFFVNGLYSRSRNRSDDEVETGLQFTLAPGQAYNPFSAFEFGDFAPGATVYYFPEDEARQGQITPGLLRNKATQWNLNTGLTYDFNVNTRLSLLYTASRARTEAFQRTTGSIVSLLSTDDGGFRCSNFQLENDRLVGVDRDAYRAAFDRQCRALTSSDPAVAFNPFKSSASGPGGSISDFQYTNLIEDRGSTLSLFEARLTGSLLKLPAGQVGYAVGGEYFTDGADSREINNLVGSVGSRKRYAGFGEMTLPLLGNGHTLPLVQALNVNFAVRHDTSELDGPVGTVDNVPLEQGGELINATNRFSRWTPSAGIRYQPFSSLTFLAKWGRGFKAPPATQLFSLAGTQRFQRIIFDDPFYTCTTDCRVPNRPSSGYAITSVFASNPDLRPETSRQESFTGTWAPGGALNGLILSATYNRTRIRNEYARSSDLSQLLTLREFYALSAINPRDANGKIIESRSTVINLRGSEYASVTYEAAYRVMTGIGNFQPRLVLVDNIRARRQTLAGSLDIDTLGRIQGPDNYRAVGSLTYDWQKFSATIFGYHTPKYRNDYLVSYGSGQVLDTFGGFARSFEVDSYTTIDLTASWTMRNGLRLNAAVRNMFDARPPFTVVEGRPYDAARYNVAGRTGLLQLEYNF